MYLSVHIMNQTQVQHVVNLRFLFRANTPIGRYFLQQLWVKHYMYSSRFGDGNVPASA